MGNAFGHLAVAVPDAYAVCDAMEKEGLDLLNKGLNFIPSNQTTAKRLKKELNNTLNAVKKTVEETGL